MARLFHLIKHRELKLKTASLVLKVTVISYNKITDCKKYGVFLVALKESNNDDETFKLLLCSEKGDGIASS